MSKLIKFTLLLFFTFIQFQLIAKTGNRENPNLKVLSLDESKTLGLVPLECGNGEVIMPRHDGKHYFISDHAPDPTKQPSQAEIDAATDDAESQGRIINVSGGLLSVADQIKELASLPVTFRLINAGLNYDVTVFAMSFTPEGSFLTIGTRFVIPGSEDNVNIYLGGEGIQVSGKGGFTGKISILDVSLSDAKQVELDDLPEGFTDFKKRFLELPVPFFNKKIWYGFGPETSFSFKCGEFEKFSLSGFFKIYDWIEREDIDGNSLNVGADGGKPFMLYFRADVEDWQNIYIKATASKGFHSKAYPDLGFHFTTTNNAVGSVIVDLSNYKNPPNLPDCAKSIGNAWQGVYFESFSVRLPKFFKIRGNTKPVKVGGKNLFIGTGGVTGSVMVYDAFPLKDGYTDGEYPFDMSVDLLSAEFECGSFIGASISGRVRLPVCDKDEEALSYNLTYQKLDNKYNGIINVVNDMNFPVFKTSKVSIKTGSFLKIEALNGKIDVTTVLTGSMDIADGETNSKLVGIKFEELRLSTKEPHIDIKAIEASGKDISFSGFPLTLNEPKFGLATVDGKKEIYANFGITLNLDQYNLIDIGGYFDIRGYLEKNAEGRIYWRNKSFDLTGLTVKGSYGTFEIDGTAIFYKNLPKYGKGFSLEVNVNWGDFMAPIKGAGAQGIFGNTGTYKYGYIDVGVDSDIQAGPVTINKMLLGFYSKMRPLSGGAGPSGISFVPDVNTKWGFRGATRLVFPPEISIVELYALIEVEGLEGIKRSDGSQDGGSLGKFLLLASANSIFVNGQLSLNEFRKGISKASGKINSYQDILFKNAPSGSLNASGMANLAKKNESTYKNILQDINSDLFPISTNLLRVQSDVLCIYDGNEKKFLGLIYPNINVLDIAKSTGIGIVYFGPDKWYIHLGNPSTERLGFDIKMNLGVIERDVQAGGYFMLGSDIPHMPSPVPSDIFSEYGLSQGSGFDESTLKNGKGFAAGANVYVSVTVRALKIASANVTSAAGVDFMVIKNPDYLCDGKVAGWDGWRGALQIYAGLKGSVDVFGLPLVSISVGAELLGSGFNPFYGAAQVTVRCKALFGLVGFNIPAKVELGKKCDPELPSDGGSYTAIDKTYPTDQAVGIRTATNPRVDFLEKINTTVTLEDRTFRTRVTAFTLESNGVSINGTFGYKDDKSVEFKPTQVLPQNAKVTAKVKVVVEELIGGVWQTAIAKESGKPDVAIEEEKTFAFTTANKLSKIEIVDIVDAYPYKDQYNFYAKMPVSFNGNTANVAGFKLSNEAVTLVGENTIKVKFKSKDGSHTVEAVASQTGDVWVYEVPAFNKNTIYEMTILKSSTGEVIFESGFHFRTSEFDMFKDKVAAIQSKLSTNNIKIATLEAGLTYFKLQMEDDNFEGFSKDELALIKTTAGKEAWYNNFKEAQNTQNGGFGNYEFDEFVDYLQPFTVSLSNGEKTKSQIINGEKYPTWIYHPFDLSVLDFSIGKDACDGNCDDTSCEICETKIPDFQSGDYAINLLINNKTTLFTTSPDPNNGNLTFTNVGDITFETKATPKRFVEITCKPNELDDEPLSFTVNVYKNENSKTNNFLITENDLKLFYGSGESYELKPKSGKFIFTNLTSKAGCPVASTVRISGGGDRYNYKYIISERPAHKPYLAVECKRKYDGVFTQTLTEAKVIVTSYANESLIKTYAATSDITITLNYGESITIKKGDVSAEKIITDKSKLGEFSGRGCPTVLSFNPATCCNVGTFKTGHSNIGYFLPNKVSIRLDDFTKACSESQLPNNLYIEGNDFKVGVNVSEVSGYYQTAPQDGYYKTDKNGGSWLKITNGKVTEIGDCANEPFVDYKCEIENSSDNTGDTKTVAKINVTIYKDKTKSNEYKVPYDVVVKLTDEKSVTIPKGSSSNEFSEISDVCFLITSVPTGYTYDAKQFDCKDKVAKPTVSSTATEVNSGTPITLTAQGCSKIVWQPVNSANFSLTVIPVSTTIYAAQCQEGSCLSEPTSIEIKVKGFEIKTDKENNTICSGNNITLTAEGCSGVVKWYPDAKTGVSNTISPMSNISYWAECTVNGRKLTSSKLNIIVNPTPLAPILSSSVSGSICNKSEVTLTTVGCQDGHLIKWYPSETKSNLNTLTIAPQTNATTDFFNYWTTCLSEKGCESTKSNIYKVKVLNPSKPIIKGSAYANSICNGFSTILQADNCSTSNLIWSDGQTGQSITIKPTLTTVYTVTCKDEQCLSAVSDPFTIQVVDGLTQPTLTANQTNICSYQNATLTSGGCIGQVEWITPSNTAWHLEGNNSLITNQSGTYRIRCNLNGCFSSENKIDIIVHPKPNAPLLYSSKNPICAGETITLTGSCTLGSLNWNELSHNSFSLTSNKTFSAFCKSDKGCVSDPSFLNETVNPIPNKPTINSSENNPICSYQLTNISATGCNGAIYWKHDNSTTNPITNINYGSTFSAKCDEKGCIGEYSDNYTLVVNSKPAAPILSRSESIICSGIANSITITASNCSGNYVWSDRSIVGASVNLKSAGTYSFTTQCESNNCFSDNSNLISATINQTPDAPVLTSNAANNILCSGNSVTISAIGCNGTIKWINNGNGGNYLYDSPSQTTTYRAKCISDVNCESAESSITIILHETPSTPSVTPNEVLVCSNGTVTLNASGGKGTYKWSNNSEGSSLGVSGKGDYRVYCEKDGCISSWSNWSNVNVNKVPDAPTVYSNASNNTICTKSDVTLYASGCDGTITWSSSEPNWGTKDGTTINESSLNNTRSYFAQCASSEGCVGVKSSITIIVNSIPEAPIISPSQTSICGGSTTLIASGCQGNVLWSGNQSGNSINVSVSGDYKAYCSQNGCNSNWSNEGKVTIKEKANEITLSENGNPNQCGVRSTWISSTNCNGNISWEDAWGREKISGKWGYILTENRTIFAKCITADNCESSKASITLNYNPSPTAPTISAGKYSLCSGEKTNLIAVGCSYSEYTVWNNGRVGNLIEVSDVGTYTATCKNDIGCESGISNSITLTSSPTASLSLDYGVHQKDGSVFLYAKADYPYITISWEPGGLTGRQIDLPKPSNTATYYGKAINLNGCESSQSSITVNPPEAYTVEECPWYGFLWGWGCHDVTKYRKSNVEIHND